MAIINPLLGRMKGKYGGSVMYSNGGKQCMRERVIEVRNPRSAKQAIQRAIAATVAKFVSAFAPVLNNSLQSEQTKVKTLAKIRGMNMNFLRQLAAQELGTYCPKGAMFVAPNDYTISRGSLRGIEPLRSDSALLEMRRTISGLFNAADIFLSSSYSASIAFPGIAVGDQITIIATSHTAIADGSQVAMCRFAFKDDTTPVFLATEDEGEFILNPAAIDLTKADGKYDELVFESATLDGSPVSRIHVGNLLGGVVFLDNFGLIVSREQNKLRSNARMVSVALSDYTIADVYPTYMDGGTAIDMPSENYLDNDADATIYFANLPSSVPYTVTLAEDARRLVKLSTNVPLGDSTNLSLTIRRQDASVTLRLVYNGPVVSSGDISISAQWLSNGYLALTGNAGDVTITEGSISFPGGLVNID